MHCGSTGIVCWWPSQILYVSEQQGVVSMHITYILSTGMNSSLSHCTPVTKHTLKDKMMKSFRMMTVEH